MSLAGSLLASLLATLTRPAWWPIALVGFLVRGGLAAVLVPVVSLPTVAGLANAFGPALVGFVFGGPSTAFLIAVGSTVAALLAWLVGAGLLGAYLDLVLVRETAEDEEVEAARRPHWPGLGRAFAVRLAAHVPTVAVLGVGAVRLVDATYQELTHPGDPAIPIPIRIALRIPETVGLFVAAWALGEAVGGLAVRHLAWGASARASLGLAVRGLVQPSALVTLVGTDLVLGAVVVASGTAAGITWGRLGIVLADGRPAPEVELALLVFSLTWTAGLWLIALAVAWRSTAWTFEVARRQPPRTIDPPTP